MAGWIIAALLLLVLLGLFLLYNNCFVVRRYRLQAPLPERDLRILLLSDLHNKQYGRGNRRQLRRIAQLRPDLIVIAGDLVDKRRPNISVGVAFAEGCAAVAPTFYISGNHEEERGNFEEIAAQMKKTRVLRNEWVSVAGIKLLGLRDHFQKPYEVQRRVLEAFEQERGYKIVAVHRPANYFTELNIRERAVDLQLSGHTHGGVAHLPFAGAFFAPGEGFLPRYVQGVYQEQGTTLVVGGGLGNTKLPLRLFNFPEIVEISLVCEKNACKSDQDMV